MVHHRISAQAMLNENHVNHHAVADESIQSRAERSEQPENNFP